MISRHTSKHTDIRGMRAPSWCKSYTQCLQLRIAIRRLHENQKNPLELLKFNMMCNVFLGKSSSLRSTVSPPLIRGGFQDPQWMRGTVGGAEPYIQRFSYTYIPLTKCNL